MTEPSAAGGEPLLWRAWNRIDVLFERALDLPAPERNAFLVSACGDELDLLEELRALIATADAAPDEMDVPSPTLLGSAFVLPEVTDALVDGDRVGPYRVVGEIGRGGMATVYEAERADGAFDRRVAIKVLRRGMDTDDVVRRFLDERRILSALVHPNIGLLIDGGSTTDGRPYLAMELVDGRPITEWVEEQGLRERARIDLFLQVADAIAFAHRRLVIHRDIKPSNVLVDPDGRVKLLDFGIAKILGGDESATGLARGAPMTPAYASPEQAEGGTMTTASDVFQLGALLFEVLTGSRFRRGTARRESARLPSDLRTIIEKALREPPEERYPSIEGLSTDIRAYLAGRPISARPPSTWYRLRKLTQRNPWLVSSVAALALLTAGYLVTLGAQARRLETERDRARELAARATALRSFLVTQFGTADPYGTDPERVREVTVVESLERAVERARQDLAGEPVLLAGILSDVATVQANLDLRESAAELVSQAMALRESEGEGRTTEQRDDLGRLAELMGRSGQPDSARPLAERRLALEREALPSDPVRVALALLGLAAVESDDGRVAHAVELLRESSELLRGAPGSREPELATVLEALADAERGVGELTLAEAAVREALEIRRRVHAPEHPAVATAEIHLAQVLDEAGQNTEAVAVYRSALPRLEASLGVDHFITEASWNNLANVLTELGDLEGAEEIHRRLLAERRARLGREGHPDVGASLQNLAVVLVRQGRLDEADPLSEEASSIYRAVYGPDHPGVAFPLLTRAEIRLLRMDGVAAEGFAAEAVRILARALPPEHYVVAAAECRLAAAQGGQNRREEAEPLAVSAHARLSASPSAPERLVRECDGALASIRGR